MQSMESGAIPGESVTVKSAYCGISQIHVRHAVVSAETVKLVGVVCASVAAFRSAGVFYLLTAHGGTITVVRL